MSKYKQFSEELYQANDTQACDVVMGYVASNGLYASRNPDKYGPDILVYHGFTPEYYIEVEVKRVWKAGTDFPWQSIHLPERKKKFLEAELSIEFWLLREDMEQAIVVPELVVRNSELITVENKLVSKGEQFFDIQLDECILIEFTNSAGGVTE